MTGSHGSSGLMVGVENLHAIRALAADYDAPIVADQRMYERGYASPARPMWVPSSVVSGLGFQQCVHAFLDAQLRAGAAVAATPSLYVAAGDVAALRALVEAANSLVRRDVLFLVPLDARWLDESNPSRAINELRRARLPVALMLGGQWDPVEKQGRPAGLRKLASQLADPYLMRCDLSTFDAYVHGAAGGGIGVSGTYRHIVKPGERTSGPPGIQPPSVLVRELVSFFGSRTLAQWFAGQRPPLCPHSDCVGRPLSDFRATTIDRLEAFRHNVHTWLQLLTELQQLPRDSRAGWLHGVREHARIRFAQFGAQTGVKRQPGLVLRELLDLGP